MMNFNNAQVKSEQISIIEHNEDGNWKNYNNSEKDAGTENEENITPVLYIYIYIYRKNILITVRMK